MQNKKAVMVHRVDIRKTDIGYQPSASIAVGLSSPGDIIIVDSIEENSAVDDIAKVLQAIGDGTKFVIGFEYFDSACVRPHDVYMALYAVEYHSPSQTKAAA